MPLCSRREFIRAGMGAGAVLPSFMRTPCPATSMAEAVTPPGEAGRTTLTLDASAAPSPALKGVWHMGTARSASGGELTVDCRSLLLNGRSWLPVSGEFHYSRYPDAEWREELLKMRSGGFDIAATYVFWIHHEEIEGRFVWTGRRNLRGFVQDCGEVGLCCLVRCGPWCHGEVRNGGFPDWLLKKGYRLRTDDPGYLDCVRRLFGEISTQVTGLLWKNDGPVVGIQIENEYGGPAEHLLTLKRIAREVGLDVPLYTRTGWPELRTPMPPDEFLPMFGDYVEGFWDRELTPMPGDYPAGFLFKLPRGNQTIGTNHRATSAANAAEVNASPYFCCEIGGGMETSYHRRIRIRPGDIESISLVKLGSGNNLQGYYMYHGGTNPQGQLSTLEESQATGYPNDLPVKSYDFQAPLGEFGQVREHYHRLRRMHLFLRDSGPLLATLPSVLPEARPASAADTATLRWSARTDGHTGCIFVNNYQRHQPMPAKAHVQFQLKLRNEELLVPQQPFTVPADTCFFWPFNFELAGTKLIYATAQPVCGVESEGRHVLVFAQIPGVPGEFVFSGEGAHVEYAAGDVSTEGGRLGVGQVKPGTSAAIGLRTSSGAPVEIVLLDHEQALTCWKAAWLGRERVFLTRASLVVDNSQLRLRAADPADLTLSIFPAPSALSANGVAAKNKADGVFRRFTPCISPRPALSAEIVPLKTAGPPRHVPMGSGGAAAAPSDEDFAAAAVWRIKRPESTDPARDLLLRVRYTGDVARFYLDGELLDDNFYNGDAFEIGLKRFAPDIYQKELLLKILPLRKDAPIYLPEGTRPDFADAASAIALHGVDLVETHEVTLLATE